MANQGKTERLTIGEIRRFFSGTQKPDWYCASSDFFPEEQKNLYEDFKDFEEDPTATSDPREIRLLKEKKTREKNGSDSVNVNDACKRRVGSELTQTKLQSKHKLITALKECNYRTPPKEIASLLGKLFIDNPSKPGHWLWVAQNRTPRQINWVLAYMFEQEKTGRITFGNPAAYFTQTIKRRKRKKSKTTSTNGTY